LAFDAIVHGIGEATDQGAPNLAVDDRVEFGVELDAIERHSDGAEEVLAQSVALLLIPVIGFVDIGLDLRFEDDGEAHRGRLTRSVMASQVVTFWGFASSAASRRSSLAFNSSVSSGS